MTTKKSAARRKSSKSSKRRRWDYDVRPEIEKAIRLHFRPDFCGIDGFDDLAGILGDVELRMA